MWSKIKIWEIRKDAIRSLYLDYNGRETKSKRIVFVYYHLIPVIISILMLLLNIFIDTSVASFFITGISIFAGLFFNLLLIVSDKLNVRKQLLRNDNNEESRNYLIRYRHFSEQLISQISYTIIISVWLILLMFFVHIKSWLSSVHLEYIITILTGLKYILNGLVFYSGYQFVIMLFVILSSMYVMMLDDLKLK